MEKIIPVLILFCAVSFGGQRAAADEICHTFRGDGFLVFPTKDININNSFHYTLEFKTDSLNGLLLYAYGLAGDFEALYIRGGHLHYRLFNTESSGTGRQFGGAYVSRERVDNNSWITVNVYRSWQVIDPVFRRVSYYKYKTGMEFELNDRLRTYTDTMERRGIIFTDALYIGGYESSLSSTVGNFTGQIKNIMGAKGRKIHHFESYSLNFNSRVDPQCQD